MRGSVLFSFALLLGVSAAGVAQDVVSASSGVLQYFEGSVVLDNKPVEHKPGVFPSLKNGSVIRTAKGRAELLLTPGVYLRMDENSSLRMVSNSLTDTRLEMTDGSAILDNLNATPSRAITIIFQESAVRFPKPGIYRIGCELGELEAYSGEAEITHEKRSSVVDSSHLYYFLLGLTIPKVGDGATDEFYDWAHNRADVIANYNQVASAEQDEAQDADPGLGGGIFATPAPFSQPSYSAPSTSIFGPSIYASAIDPLYGYASTPFPYFSPSPVFVFLSPFRRRIGVTRWPERTGIGYHPLPLSTQYPTGTHSGSSYLPGSTLRFPTGAGFTYRPPMLTPARPIVTPVPRFRTPSVAAHPAAPHLGALGHR